MTQWVEEQLGVYEFSGSPNFNTQYIPLSADLSVKCNRFWVAAYGEFSGVAENPAVFEVFGCDGYQGTETSGWEFAGPGLGFVINALNAHSYPDVTSSGLLEAHGQTFSGDWHYHTGDLSDSNWIKYPRLALRFNAWTTEDYPAPNPIWASAKVMYGID